jgi:hypothetical protein
MSCRPDSKVPFPSPTFERANLWWDVYDYVKWAKSKLQSRVVSLLFLIAFGLSGCRDGGKTIDQKFLFEAILEDNISDFNDSLKAVSGSETDISRMLVFDPIQNTSSPILHATAKYDSVAIMEWLIAAGANIEIQDSNGRVAGEIAVKYGSKKSLALLKREPRNFSDQSIFNFLSSDPLFIQNWPIRKVNDTIFSEVNDNFVDIKWGKSVDGVSIVGQATVSGLISSAFTGAIIAESGYWYYDQKSSSLQ